MNFFPFGRTPTYFSFYAAGASFGAPGPEVAAGWRGFELHLAALCAAPPSPRRVRWRRRQHALMLPLAHVLLSSINDKVYFCVRRLERGWQPPTRLTLSPTAILCSHAASLTMPRKRRLIAIAHPCSTHSGHSIPL